MKTKTNDQFKIELAQENIINQFDTLEKELIESAIKDGVRKLSVGAAVINNSKLLILQRNPDDFMPNIYELPGGGLEGSESLLDALDRELFEETKCKIKKILGYIGHIDFLSSNQSLTRRFNFLVQPQIPLKVELSEHQSYAWILPSETIKYNITPQTQKIIKSANDALMSKKILI